MSQTPRSSQCVHRVHTVHGHHAHAYLDDLARLRLSVFREYPYLYDGTLAYEQEYLEYYLASPRSVFVIAHHGDAVIGVSTGIPLIEDNPAFGKPFHETAYSPDRVYYFGESVLLPEYRGQGIGRAFFEARENFVAELNQKTQDETGAKQYDWMTFCAVQRDPAKLPAPEGYQSPERIWHKRGFQAHPELTTQLSWPQIGHVEEQTHTLMFWLKPTELSS